MSKSSLFGLVHKQHRGIACNKIMIFFGKKNHLANLYRYFAKIWIWTAETEKSLHKTDRQTHSGLIINHETMALEFKTEMTDARALQLAFN